MNHQHYMTGEVPAVGDRVTHYVDGDTGTVLNIGGEFSGRPDIMVKWSTDPDPSCHYPDEVSLITSN